jgi:mannitol 2-dehydrogenase
VLREALAAGAPVAGLALVEALWARMCEGTRENGTAIEPNDPHWPALARCAAEARHDPGAWLRQAQIYGTLSGEAAFADAFGDWLRRLWADGCRATLRAYVTG